MKIKTIAMGKRNTFLNFKIPPNKIEAVDNLRLLEHGTLFRYNPTVASNYVTYIPKKLMRNTAHLIVNDNQNRYRHKKSVLDQKRALHKLPQPFYEH